MAGFIPDEAFDLPVDYQGRELLFPSRLSPMGYTYKIFVQVEGQEIVFEPDEERNLRAIVEQGPGVKAIPVDLIRAVGASLEELLR